jgi:hypothetical protein
MSAIRTTAEQCFFFSAHNNNTLKTYIYCILMYIVLAGEGFLVGVLQFLRDSRSQITFRVFSSRPYFLYFFRLNTRACISFGFVKKVRVKILNFNISVYDIMKKI